MERRGGSDGLQPSVDLSGINQGLRQKPLQPGERFGKFWLALGFSFYPDKSIYRLTGKGRWKENQVWPIWVDFTKSQKETL